MALLLWDQAVTQLLMALLWDQAVTLLTQLLWDQAVTLLTQLLWNQTAVTLLTQLLMALLLWNQTAVTLLMLPLHISSSEASSQPHGFSRHLFPPAEASSLHSVRQLPHSFPLYVPWLLTAITL
jgi:hypothetical protein